MPDLSPCRWCGELHGPICPWVKALEFDPEGRVSRVEFLTSADFPQRKTDAEGESAAQPDYETLKSSGAKPK